MWKKSRGEMFHSSNYQLLEAPSEPTCMTELNMTRLEFSNILNDNQLENMKEKAYDLNKTLIQHVYEKHLPYLMKQKCKQSNKLLENELDLLMKLISCIEDNVSVVLNRI